MSSPTLTALVVSLRHEAEGIISVELRPAVPHVAFPSFDAGAHIDLHLPNGLTRSYSLCNASSDGQRYVIGVLHDRKSRGGSRYVHEQLRVGSRIEISAPRNNFALNATATHTVLVAGGIGVTPIWCMLQQLVAQRHSVELLYCARSRNEAAFLAEIQELCGHHVRTHFHFDDEEASGPSLLALLQGKGTDTHYYCCGPAPMLDAFEAACDALGYPHAHIERFTAVTATDVVPDGSFTVELAQRGITLEVSAGQSILDAMLDAGIAYDHSCKEGVCGSCEAPILAGEALHRDGVLSKKERELGKTMMVCVSRCKRGPLVLDI